MTKSLDEVTKSLEEVTKSLEEVTKSLKKVTKSRAIRGEFHLKVPFSETFGVASVFPFVVNP